MDLKSTLEIGRITYFPRSDCCQDRQADVNVVILNAARNEVSRTNINSAGFNTTDAWPQDYSPTVFGRYVRIERMPTGAPDANGIPSDAYLNIAEVQVFNVFRPTMDIGIYKNVSLPRQMRLQVRLEWINALNYTVLWNPGVNPRDATFGIINQDRNNPRDLQIGLRLTF